MLRMVTNNPKRVEFYNWVRIAGLASFIPFILCAGPIVGYWIGANFEKMFRAAPYTKFIFTAIGFAASIKETLRIVDLIMKNEKKS